MDSIKTDPAIVDFGLTGIWELCGAQSKLVQEAWDAYGAQMRPKLVIATSTSWEPPKNPVVPAITLGRIIAPTTPPQNNSGYQIIVLNGLTDITKREAVLLNRYYTLNADHWADNNAYKVMYDEAAQDLEAGGLTADGNILIVAGFNINWDCVPTSRFTTILRNAGGGAQLTNWLSNRDVGSAYGPSANVILVGIFGEGIGSDVELIHDNDDVGRHGSIPVQIQALFYRKTDGNGYSLGVGDVS
jgi:hypothetical protein